MAALKLARGHGFLPSEHGAEVTDITEPGREGGLFDREGIRKHLLGVLQTQLNQVGKGCGLICLAEQFAKGRIGHTDRSGNLFQ